MNIRQWTKKLMTGTDYALAALDVPALLFNRDTLLDYSPAALPIIEHFNRGSDGFSDFINKITDEMPIAEDKVVLSHTPLRIFWMTGSKLQDDRLLVIARDVSSDEKLLQAFISSRELYGDLIRCSADFGWETDETGAIIYIGPDQGLGWSGPEVAGEDAWHLFCPECKNAGGVNPFVATKKQEHRNVNMSSRSGEKRRMAVTSLPKFDDKGHWIGTRGACRDITDEYQAAKSARHISARNAVFSRIVAAMRTEIGAEELLRATATAVAEVLRSDASWVIRPDKDEALYIGVDDFNQLGDEVMKASHNTLDWRAKKEGCSSLSVAGRDMQMLTVAGENILDGAIVISRDTNNFPWKGYEAELLQDIFEHLALALKQAALFETLERLSTIDELTKLYNRRAFSEMVGKRIAAQRRNLNTGCLLYIDLDNFKEVNDTLGHAAGDEVLKFLGGEMISTIRAEDLPGRLGGDEFALWLEATDAVGATVKANEFIALAPKLKLAAGDKNLNLGLSIGIAVSDPEKPVTFDTLTASADEALYRAKHAGKGTVVVA